MHKFHIYKNHPILLDLRDALLSVGTNKELLRLYVSSVGFMYPKTIIFSFGGIEESDLDQYFAERTPVAEDSSEQYENRHAYSHEGRSKWGSVLRALANAVASRQHDLTFLIDVSSQAVLDEQLLDGLLLDFITKQVKAGILCSSEQEDDLRGIADRHGTQVFSQVEQVHKHFRRTIDDPSNSNTVLIPHVLDLQAMEKCFADEVFLDAVATKKVVILDFSKVHKIHFFAILLANVYVHCLSHAYGIVWKVRCQRGSDIASLLKRYSIFNLNTHIVTYECNEADSSNSEDVFGAIMFDERTQSSVMKAFESYLGGISRKNPYLMEHISVKDQSRSFSYRREQARLPIYYFIEQIVYELIDNITEHSESVGFIAAHNTGRFLYLFIGDCGIGIRKGICKNYGISHLLRSEDSALESWFDLVEYMKYRKKEEFGIEAGYGLADTLSYIFTCKGKFLFRSGQSIGSFMNPVSRIIKPKLLQSQFSICGIQYCVMIPLTRGGYDQLPKTTEEFMAKEF